MRCPQAAESKLFGAVVAREIRLRTIREGHVGIWTFFEFLTQLHFLKAVRSFSKTELQQKRLFHHVAVARNTARHEACRNQPLKVQKSPHFLGAPGAETEELQCLYNSLETSCFDMTKPTMIEALISKTSISLNDGRSRMTLAQLMLRITVIAVILGGICFALSEGNVVWRVKTVVISCSAIFILFALLRRQWVVAGFLVVTAVLVRYTDVHSPQTVTLSRMRDAICQMNQLTKTWGVDDATVTRIHVLATEVSGKYRDGWGKELIFVPGGEDSIVILSLGADKKEGGCGSNADMKLKWRIGQDFSECLLHGFVVESESEKQ